LRLKEESEVLQEVVVTAKAVRNTEAALMTIQKKAPGLLNGVTTQAIKRSGDSDVGSAIKRVTGVSVEGGKHVVVRGLVDRYSKTILNGLEVPGLDPDKNSVQLDIFPTNLVDNIIVYKSFTPDLPGDFSGGMVNIETKEFPESRTFEISGSVGYNPNMNLNDNYITYEGGGTDFLGFDDGTRELPINPNGAIPERTESNTALTGYTQKFSPIMSTMRENSSLNSSFSISYGNQINKDKFDIGYTLSANYKNETQYYEDARFGVYFKEQDDNSIYALANDRSDAGQLGLNNVIWSTLAGVAIKTQRHKISLSALRSQNGESRAAFINSIRKEFGQAELEKHNLEYTERSVTNVLLKGNHSNKQGNFEINWQLSPTLSLMSDPDIRLTAFEINPDDGAYELNPSTAGLPTRTYRSLEEMNYAGRLDFVLKLDGKMKNKIKFGVNGVYKDRDFSILDYNFALHKRGTFDLTGDPNELFEPQNLWTLEGDRGLFVDGASELAKTYQAQMRVLAGYVMNEMEVTKSLKAIYGLRVEQAQIWYTGRKEVILNPQTDLFDNRKVLDELDFLPSLSLVQNLSDQDGKTVNLRASVSRTIARPSFKEKSIAQIQDRISGRAFQGNPDLIDTKIVNADLRLEYFLPKGETVSLSGFYKSFDNPIELTSFSAFAPNTFTPRNVGEASLYGIEIEFVKRLDFIAKSLEHFSINANTTIVQSSVNMTDNEFEGRVLTAREGEVIDGSREMVGQSPYVINAALNYIEPTLGWEGNVSYNVQGRRLAIVGIGKVPDVYDNPFHSLNLKVSKRMGEEQKLKISLSVQNLLDSNREKVYGSFNADDELFERLSPRRTISIGVGYRFF
ncbi:MAG: TonB-dependent receptor plug domain-containing protein, partial [Bacteroidia bacterium]|nr:TonB-dependent receptor plug domain-containing protein [Bacteroidia bacterium]